MKKLRILILLLCCHSAFAEYWDEGYYANIKGENISYLDISNILFPEAEGWISIASFPLVLNDSPKILSEKLLSAYMNADIDGKEAYYNCQSLTIISSNKATVQLRSFDFNNDGLKDIVYSGPDECSEQHLTLIWYGRNDGFEMRQNNHWESNLLKVLPGKAQIFTSVEIGCCASPIDILYLGDMDKSNKNRAVTITKNLIFPALKVRKIKFSNYQETYLRTSPAIIAKNNAEKVNYITDGMIGNIISKFRSGLSGYILGEHTDNDGKKWVFVCVDVNSNYLRYFNAYKEINLNVGWIEKENKEIGKKP